MASVSFDPKKNGYRLSFLQHERKKSLWLGDVTAATAAAWKRHVEHLLFCARRKEPPCLATSDWLLDLSEDDHAKLSSCGLTMSRERARELHISLGDWLETYLLERIDVKASTMQTYEKARDSLLAYFPATTPLRSIRPEDAQRWRRWLATAGNRRDKQRQTMADATVRRRTGKAKQFFAEAVERGMVEANPFAKLASSATVNAMRQFFVPADRIESCIQYAPGEQFRTVLALARYGALRIPSELMTLRWIDVDLPAGRFTVHATKTEHHQSGGVRVVPIFPELRPYLEAARDALPDGQEYVVWQYRRGGGELADAI